MVFKRRDRPSFPQRAREFFYPRRGWRRALEYLAHRVRRLPDTPHKIALGFACGVFVSFTPFFGLHFFLAFGIAWALRGNVVAALIGTAVGNPLTFPVIASIALALGRRILGYGASGRDFSRVADAFKEAAQGLWEGLLRVLGLGSADWHKLAAFFQDVLLPYLVGGILPGIVAGIASYYVTRPLIAAYQLARRARLASRRRKASRGAADGDS